MVKEVHSGDTLTVAGGTGLGAPEKRLTLSSLTAPKLGRRDGSSRDEPFAWEAREFLRKLAIGKPCVFRSDYSIEAAGGREFGSVFLCDKDNVALAVTAAGWARVRPPGGQQSPYYDDLVRASAAAEAAGAGVFTKDSAALAHSVRPPADEFDAADFLSSQGGRGRPVTAIVDAVLSGSTLRATFLPGLESAVVMVAGVLCPSLGRRPPPPAAGTPAAAGADGEAADGASVLPPAATAPAASAAPERLSREAKHFAESRVLNREVKLVLQGVSQHGVLLATVLVPAPAPAAPAPAPTAANGAPANGAAAPPTNGAAAAPGSEDLGLSLVKAGLAKAVDWSLNQMASGAFTLREAERTARGARVGIWHGYVPQPGASAKLSDKFGGHVIEVVSGDCLVIKDRASGAERRINLSSVRAPRPSTRDRAADPWAHEAKEFLRSRLVGREVAVQLEYTRKVPFAGGEERLMSFGTVSVSERPEGASEDKVSNVAELLLVRGLGQVVRHRGDEERSAHYEDLVAAEEVGKKGKKGQWSAREAPPPRVNDVSLPGSGARARQFLSFLQRGGRVPAVCEAVLSGHRLKLHVPKEGVTIAFSPSGVRCPQRSAAPGAAARPGAPPPQAAEPFGDEAFAFTREHVLQRDVELEVEGVDKGGTFLGTLRVPGQKGLNLGVALLESGLARLHPAFDSGRVVGGTALVAAQDRAKAARVKVWESYDPAAEAAAGAEAEADDAGGAGGATQGVGEPLRLVVTDVADANNFFVQVADEPRVKWVTEQLASLGLGAASPPPSILKAGDKCVARFSADGQWYRAVVERTNAADPTSPQYDVLFLDYGNRERVRADALRALPADLAAVPGQAQQATLAHVKAPGLDDEWGVEAAQLLSELAGGGAALAARVLRRERLPAPASGAKQWGAQAPSRLHVLLQLGGEGDSANAALLRAGLARLVEPPREEQGSPALDALRTAQEEARAARAGMWVYGDPGSASEEESYPNLANKAGGRRR